MSEHNEQAAFVDYVLNRYWHDRTFLVSLFYAVPNGAWLGGKKPYAMMNKLKAEGLRRGVADLIYQQPRGSHPFLAIEMKDARRRNESNGGMTDDQIAYADAALRVGAFYRVAFTCEEAMAAFDEYMQLPEREP